eukprot:Skav203094  [mRNA]  locus=scaffold447:165798:183615:+ [translate_table: standard]
MQARAGFHLGHRATGRLGKITREEMRSFFRGFGHPKARGARILKCTSLVLRRCCMLRGLDLLSDSKCPDAACLAQEVADRVFDLLQDKKGDVEYAVFMSHFESVLGCAGLETRWQDTKEQRRRPPRGWLEVGWRAQAYRILDYDKDGKAWECDVLTKALRWINYLQFTRAHMLWVNRGVAANARDAAVGSVPRRRGVSLPPQQVVVLPSAGSLPVRGISAVRLPATLLEERGSVRFFAVDPYRQRCGGPWFRSLIDVTSEEGRSWRVLRRYNDFWQLKEQLGQSSRHLPGAPKHLFACSGAKLEERREQLELWLSSVIQQPRADWIGVLRLLVWTGEAAKAQWQRQ